MAKKKEKAVAPAAITIPTFWNISQLSLAFECERRTMAERLHAARTPFQPGPRNSKLYRFTDVFESLLAERTPAPDPENGAKSVVNEIQNEELRLAKLKREKAEISLNIMRGEFVPVAGVIEQVSGEYATIRTRLLALPARISRQVAQETDTELVNKTLTETIDEALEALRSDALKEIERLAEGTVVSESSDDGTADPLPDQASQGASADPEAEASPKPG